MTTIAPENLELRLDKSDWKRVTFGEVVRNVNETVKDPSSLGIDRIIAMEHLDPGELKVARWGDLSDGTTFTRRVKPGQTLFGKRRAYQRKAAFADFDAICSGDILVFEADAAQLLPEILPFLVQSNGFYDHALGTSAGSLSPRTNWRDLSNYEFDLPPLHEQKRLADLLWSVERHIRMLREERASLSILCSTWLDGAMRGLSGQASRLGDVVADSAYGPRFSNSLYSDDAKYRLLRTTDMDAVGNVDYETMPRADLDRTFDPHLLCDGDFLISRSGTCGVPAVFDLTKGGAFVIPGAFLIRLRLKPDLDPHFLRAFMNSTPGRELSSSLAQGGVQKNIRGSALLECEVPLPPEQVQRDLLRRLAAFEAATAGLTNEEGCARRIVSAVLTDLGGAA